MKNEFNINDEVKVNYLEGKYIIVASKEQPRIRKNMTRVFPDKGFDFLVVEMSNEEFRTLHSVLKEHLEHFKTDYEK
jgi:hypothetical protein